MFNYVMLAVGLVGFFLIVLGPGRHTFHSGYTGNPTEWVVTVGFMLLFSSAAGPLVIKLVQQATSSSSTQVQPVGDSAETRQSIEAVNEKPMQSNLKKDDVSAIEVCENIPNFFSKNSCRFEQCEKQENLAKPECEKFLKK